MLAPSISFWMPEWCFSNADCLKVGKVIWSGDCLTKHWFKWYSKCEHNSFLARHMWLFYLNEVEVKLEGWSESENVDLVQSSVKKERVSYENGRMENVSYPSIRMAIGDTTENSTHKVVPHCLRTISTLFWTRLPRHTFQDRALPHVPLQRHLELRRQRFFRFQYLLFALIYFTQRPDRTPSGGVNHIRSRAHVFLEGIPYSKLTRGRQSGMCTICVTEDAKRTSAWECILFSKLKTWSLRLSGSVYHFRNWKAHGQTE